MDDEEGKVLPRLSVSTFASKFKWGFADCAYDEKLSQPANERENILRKRNWV